MQNKKRKQKNKNKKIIYSVRIELQKLNQYFMEGQNTDSVSKDAEK